MTANSSNHSLTVQCHDSSNYHGCNGDVIPFTTTREVGLEITAIGSAHV
jgi:hypothetical protein